MYCDRPSIQKVLNGVTLVPVVAVAPVPEIKVSSDEV